MGWSKVPTRPGLEGTLGHMALPAGEGVVDGEREYDNSTEKGAHLDGQACRQQ